MHTPLLIGTFPEEVRVMLYFQRFSELFLGFHIHIEEPYAICAAYLLLERNGELEYAHRQYTDLRRAMSAPGRG